jgi:(p)ppGpp synthase/HD superfamily hydrolase
MDTKRIFAAANFAAAAHISQRRKFDGSPYINHLLRVGESAVKAGLPTDAIIAGVLHDVIEDTSTSYEQLEKHFSQRTVSLVRLLTKWWPENSPSELNEKNKVEYYRKILEDQEAVELKLLDRADNIGDAINVVVSSESWVRSYLAETEREFPALKDKSANPIATEIFDGAYARLVAALSRV